MGSRMARDLSPSSHTVEPLITQEELAEFNFSRKYPGYDFDWFKVYERKAEELLSSSRATDNEITKFLLFCGISWLEDSVLENCFAQTPHTAGFKARNFFLFQEKKLRVLERNLLAATSAYDLIRVCVTQLQIQGRPISEGIYSRDVSQKYMLAMRQCDQSFAANNLSWERDYFADMGVAGVASIQELLDDITKIFILPKTQIEIFLKQLEQPQYLKMTSTVVNALAMLLNKQLYFMNCKAKYRAYYNYNKYLEIQASSAVVPRVMIFKNPAENQGMGTSPSSSEESILAI
jgi:hypothetical protein